MRPVLYAACWFACQRKRMEVIEMDDWDMILMIVMFVGIGMAIGTIIFGGPYANTVNELCEQKYGIDGYTISVEDGYAVCDAKKTVDVQCRVDGIGLKRCEGN